MRFTQGRGNYVDGMKPPGMLHGDFARSQHARARARARIVGIYASRAKALPGVVAVLTADDLRPLGLHWMPTLAGDVQAVLADGTRASRGQVILAIQQKSPPTLFV